MDVNNDINDADGDEEEVMDLEVEKRAKILYYLMLKDLIQGNSFIQCI